MKILLVSQRFFPAIGGAELVLEQLADFLSERHEVTVYTTDAIELSSFWNPENGKIGEIKKDKNYKVNRYRILTPLEIDKNLQKFPFSIGIPGPFSLDMWNDIFRFAKNFDLIIVSAFPYNHVIPAYFISGLYKTPIISIPHIHLEFPELYLTGLRLALLDKSNVIVVNTLAEKDAISKHNISAEKIHVIPLGLDFSSWNMNENTQSQMLTSSRVVKVLYAGNRSAEKGIINLVEAMKKLWKKNIDTDLIIIGSSTKEYDDYIKKQEQYIKHHVHDLGIVNDEEKKIIFHSCDIVALPSKSESFGLTYLEGWMCKKPVIGCKIRAVSEVIDNEVNGLLVDFGAIDQLSNALERLVKDDNLRQFLGNNGNKKLTSKYDSKKNLPKLEEICMSLN